MSRLWVKICANTSLADAQHAIRVGADAVGFVFASESKRRVGAEQVAAITPHLPADAEKLGVFVEQTVPEIVEIVRATRLTGVQMYAPSADHATHSAAQLRESLRGLHRRLRIVQALHFNAENQDNFENGIRQLAKNQTIDAILIDSRVFGAMGGTGIAFDWHAARQALMQAAVPRMHLIVAGGLTPTNVAHAVHTLIPWGVDVASGVEQAAGVKDPRKVEQFIAAARQADIEARKTAMPAQA